MVGYIQEIYLKLFINVCCQFTGYNNNRNNGNSQAVFQNDANTRVGQQIRPNGKQQSLQHISIFDLCKLQNE